MTAPRRPSLLQGLNLLLLFALAALLFAPLLGFGRPPITLIIAMLTLRLALQIIRARTEPHLRRPVAWLVDVALLIVLVSLR